MMSNVKWALRANLAVALLLAACAEQKAQAPSSAAVAGVGAIGPVAGTEEDLAKNVGDRVFFDFDQSLLKPEGRATLERQAVWLAKYPAVNVQIAGNCDERGTEEYDIVLGNRRAYVAGAYLQAHGVTAERISTISFGKDQPVAFGSDEQSWAQNRNAITSVR